MTDDYGLGGLYAEDPRDWPIAQLYDAQGIAALATFPPSYLALPVPPVLNQGSTPQCVAYAGSNVKAHQDRIDEGQFFPFDEARFFREIGGTSSGAYISAALKRLKDYGYPIVGVAAEGKHKIAAYYAVPRTVDDLKSALLTFGPLWAIGQWYREWDYAHVPSSGVLPKPVTEWSGHSVYLDGYNATGVTGVQSWGPGYGAGGRFTIPWAYLFNDTGHPGYLWAAYKTVDTLEYAQKVVRCAGGKLYTGPGTNYEVKAILPATSKASISATWTKQAWKVKACGVTVSGTKWYRIVALNGLSAQARWGVPAVFTQTAWF